MLRSEKCRNVCDDVIPTRVEGDVDIAALTNVVIFKPVLSGSAYSKAIQADYPPV